MKKNIYFLMVMALVLLMLGGCRTAPILNINDAAISVPGHYTLNDVKKSIIRAGLSLGWQMRPEEPGRIQGTLYLRDIMAKIDIMYDKHKYSIHYKDSKNLKYDGKNIHSNYNGWIERLNHTIQVQLANM